MAYWRVGTSRGLPLRGNTPPRGQALTGFAVRFRISLAIWSILQAFSGETGDSGDVHAGSTESGQHRVPLQANVRAASRAGQGSGESRSGKRVHSIWQSQPAYEAEAAGEQALGIGDSLWLRGKSQVRTGSDSLIEPGAG